MEERELLVVKSKLKAYIKSQGLSCGGDIAEILSNQLYEVIDGAIEEAKRQKNKTVLSKHLV